MSFPQPVTKEALLGRTNFCQFQHKTEKKKDGTPVTVRQNGKMQTWKRSPERFSIPVKYGMYQCFYITSENSDHWEII